MQEFKRAYGSFEIEPPFKLIVRVLDQNGYGVYANVKITADDEVYEDCGSQIVFRSNIKYSLDEVKISVYYDSTFYNETPTSFEHTIKVHVEPPPILPQNETKSQSIFTPPVKPKKINKIKEKVKNYIEKRYDESQLKESLEVEKEQVLPPDPNQVINFAVESFVNERKHELLNECYDVMNRKDIPKIISKIKSVSKVLNQELQKKFKGKPTLSITNLPSGPIALRATVNQLTRQNPEVQYYDFFKKTPPKHCNILLDISASTSAMVYSESGIYAKIQNALYLAAWSIAEVIIELGGKVHFMTFSDSLNDNHCQIFPYDKSNQSHVIENLMNITPAGGTRLDEALTKLTKNVKMAQAETTFIFLDGAPMEGLFRVDIDDSIQQESIKQLQALEQKSHIFILWASSPNNEPSYDQFFFNRCLKELIRTQTVNVQSFPSFVKHAQKIWQMPAVSRKIHTPFNTENVFPFQISDKIKSEIEKLQVSSNIEETVNRVYDWLLKEKKFTYTLPYDRKYRSAMEVIENGSGCCGELSNLLVGIFRSFQIPSGILEISYIQKVKVNHACVGLMVGTKMYCVDICMGGLTVKDAIGNPVSDLRWQQMVNYWRSNVRIIRDRE